jgi:predicted RNA-binding Zn-ribbon protein involved in translation (DUF1610 family)
MPGCGTYFCLACGAQVALRETEELPECASCGSSRFRRDSIFSTRQEHGGPTAELSVLDHHAAPYWLEEARLSLERPGAHLAWREDDEQVQTFAIERAWTRIGRSETADVYLDDPTVSRRHAMIVVKPGRGLRVLDDRSLNGIFLNGKPIELARVDDGDELAVGRFRLYLLIR